MHVNQIKRTYLYANNINISNNTIRKNWFNIEHSYSQGTAFMEMTEEKMQVLEATIIRMFVHESGGTVFYITEP